MKNVLFAVLLLWVLGLAPEARSQKEGSQLVLVAHPAVVEDSCNKRTLSRIFLGKKTVWDDGTTIAPVLLDQGDLYKQFTENMLERSISRFEAFWKQAVFTGRGIPPRTFDSEQELLDFVAATPGAIGYVAQGTTPAGVKIIICH